MMIIGFVALILLSIIPIMMFIDMGDEDNKEPNISGTVGENDGEEGIEIITSGGKELALEMA